MSERESESASPLLSAEWDFGAGLQKGQVPDSLDLIPGGVGDLKDGGTRDAYLLVWETLRAFPPVFGVPLPGKDGKGEHAVVAWALHDPLVVGQDASIFMWDRATRAKRGDGSSGPLISLSLSLSLSLSGRTHSSGMMRSRWDSRTRPHQGLARPALMRRRCRRSRVPGIVELARLPRQALRTPYVACIRGGA